VISAVRFGRVPKREKARILAAMQQSSSSRSHERAVTAELEDEGRLMTTVIRAHIETCDFTQDKIRPVLQQARENPSFCAPTTLVSWCKNFCSFVNRIDLGYFCVDSRDDVCGGAKSTPQPR
jgi:hypothetical protein